MASRKLSRLKRDTKPTSAGSADNAFEEGNVGLLKAGKSDLVQRLSAVPTTVGASHPHRLATCPRARMLRKIESFDGVVIQPPSLLAKCESSLGDHAISPRPLIVRDCFLPDSIVSGPKRKQGDPLSRKNDHVPDDCGSPDRERSRAARRAEDWPLPQDIRSRIEPCSDRSLTQRSLAEQGQASQFSLDPTLNHWMAVVQRLPLGIEERQPRGRSRNPVNRVPDASPVQRPES